MESIQQRLIIDIHKRSAVINIWKDTVHPLLCGRQLSLLWIYYSIYIIVVYSIVHNWEHFYTKDNYQRLKVWNVYFYLLPSASEPLATTLVNFSLTLVLVFFCSFVSLIESYFIKCNQYLMIWDTECASHNGLPYLCVTCRLIMRFMIRMCMMVCEKKKFDNCLIG